MSLARFFTSTVTVDFVLPSRLTQPDRIVHGGGHVISLTHPNDVNDYIRRVLDQVTDKTG